MKHNISYLFLTIIMILLLFQITFNLFIHELTSTEVNAIDVVVRTTAASIFGYIISCNVTKKKVVQEEVDKPSKYQIIIVGCIGIFSLVILIIARDFFTLNTYSAATITQFRDFVSGSVGFLIGLDKKS